MQIPPQTDSRYNQDFLLKSHSNAAMPLIAIAFNTYMQDYQIIIFDA